MSDESMHTAIAREIQRTGAKAHVLEHIEIVNSFGQREIVADAPAGIGFLMLTACCRCGGQLWEMTKEIPRDTPNLIELRALELADQYAHLLKLLRRL